MKEYIILFLAFGCLVQSLEEDLDWISKGKTKYQVPEDVDCTLRGLALEFSQEILNGQGSQYIYDALDLNSCSNFQFPYTKFSVKISDETIPSNPKKFHDNQQSVEYYVATDGNDNYPGTLSQPFRTLHRARDQIRISQRMQRFPTTVYVRGGIYYLGEIGSFYLGPEDSGTPDAPILYTNYNGEQVTLSGGIPLSLTWKPYQDGIWTAKLPSNLTSAFNTLFIDGIREIRARFPNGDPTIPWSGYATAVNGLPQEDINGTFVNIDQPQRVSTWPNYNTLYGGSVRRYTAFYSCNTDSRVGYGLYYNLTTFSKNNWENPSDGIVHMYHPYGWGNWMYQVESKDDDTGLISFSEGGWQEGRGGPIGPLFFVENIFEELDAEREWYSDGSQLYYYPRSDVDMSNVSVVIPLLENVINVRGFWNDPVQFVEFSGFQMTHTSTTFMKRYEVPSGGDYSIYRGGAIFIEGATNITVDNFYFNQLGGNGVFLSNFAVNNSITNSEFYLIGDNCISSVGTSNLILANQNAPSYNTIANNHFHDFGNYGKQTSAYFQSVAHHNILRQNVIYNGPRAGICFNDGFIGGDIIENNLLFNLVRETGDHGPFNSWDRMPYVYGFPDGVIVPETHVIQHNFIINRNFLGATYGSRTLDHDDGSNAYLDINNLLLYGSVKFRDGCNREASQNLIINDQIMSSEMQFLCNFTEISSQEVFSDNVVVTYSPWGLAYECYELPSVRNPPFISQNNRFYTPLNSTLPFTVADMCPGANNVTQLSEWQALGFDQGSTISDSISLEEILSLAKQKINFY